MSRVKMKLLGFLLLVTTGADAIVFQCNSSDLRRPGYNDISVECGTATINLAILMCPVSFTGYNETNLFLNHIERSDCQGTLDLSVTPPVIRFSFPINMTSACGSKFVTTSGPGKGIFSDFSDIESVNISGMVRSRDPTVGPITYKAELKYLYSCAYSLQYLINNTRANVSSASVALNHITASFSSTLAMELYSDIMYDTPLVMPVQGLELRTTIFVLVRATKLTSQYNVHLDRCYTSTSPTPTNTSIYDLFVGCENDLRTRVIKNGEGQDARFYFQAFRWVEQRGEMVSTYFLHCVIRLCEISACKELKCNYRWVRDVSSSDSADSPTATLTSKVPIVVRNGNTMAPEEKARGSSSSTVGLAVVVGALSVVLVASGMVAVALFLRF